MARTWGRKLEEAVPILTLGAGLLALFFGVENWWVIFVVGWVVLTPLADILVDDAPSANHGTNDGSATADHDDAEDVDDTADALDTLRDRYARGELTEVEFERKVERLLETETVEDAREHVGSEGGRPATVERDSARAVRQDERSVEGEAEPATDRESER